MYYNNNDKVKMNIYVGNLERNLTEEELKEAFTAFGEVTSVSIIKDKFTGAPRGFGFVEMPNKEEAQAAIDALNGQDLKGRALTVNEARPRENNDTRPPRRGGSSGGGFGGGPRRDRNGGGGGGFGSGNGGSRRPW